MKHAEIKAMMAELAPVIREFTAAALAPVTERLAALEKRLGELPTPQDGKDADPAAVAVIVRDQMSDDLAELRALIEAIPPAPELPDIPAMIEEVVSAARGADVAQVKSWMAGIEATIAAIPPAQDGKDADLEEMAALVKSEVEHAVAAIPVPQDGKSVTVEELRPLIEESVSKAVSAIPVPKDGQPGKDGVGMAGAIIDRSGNLTLTLTDGTTRELGMVVGKDGDVGQPGKDGRDGFSLSDFDASLMDDGRTVLLSFEQGEIKHFIELGFPAMIYRGVWKEGPYNRGDTVTWGGSLWHCDVDGTTEKPDGGKGWRLAVKRGRDGKDGVMKPEPEKKPVRVG